MFANLLLAVLPLFAILLMSEFLWHKQLLKGEYSRKFVHILSGTWIAFWPHYLPFDGIFIFGFCVLALLLYGRTTDLLPSIFAVKRRSYGVVLYAIAIIFGGLFAAQPWIFTTAILFLSLADGFAAVAGKLWGKSNEYLVFGQKSLHKSVAGTSIYILFGYVALAIGITLADSRVDAPVVLLALPIGAAAIENVMPYGFDNALIPMMIIGLLNTL